jgi:hypothetical protein
LIPFKNIAQFLLVAVVLFCGYLMLQITWPYFSFDYEIGFLLTKQAILHLTSWRWAFYLHISTSLVVLVLGVFQFLKPMLVRFPQTHRIFGKIYVLFILFFSAPSGLIMAFYANGGIWTKISFVIISVLWWLFTLVAFLKIKKGNVKSHLDFMTRSYALTLSAITLRTLVVVLPHFFILHSREMYILVSWLSWVPNLIVAEILIRSKR